MLQLVQDSAMLDPLRRAVHDHVRRVGKEALLEITGAQSLVDRRILQELRGAIAHVLRNAVDHGIEPADERARAGKPARAHLHLALRGEGTTLELDVIDDGRGLDADAIRATAISRGVVSPASAAAMSRDEILGLIWVPGFSTSCEVTSTSGRGVGLDAVRDCVKKLSGTVDVSSRPGRGTTFHFRVPFSLHLRSAARA
jgi:chemotaxis protein histidine kinase CheA